MNRLIYWRNFLERDLENPYDKDSYVLIYSFFNKSYIDIRQDLVYLNSKTDLYEFLKYYIIQSIIMSLIFEDEGLVIDSVEDPYDILDFLQDNIDSLDPELISLYKDSLNELENIKESDNFLQLSRSLLNRLNLVAEDSSNFFFHCLIYKNLEDFATSLVGEKDNPLNIYLQESFEYNEEEIINLFTSIEDNLFMQIRLKEIILDNLDIF